MKNDGLLSEYELQRLENIARNKRKLKELGIEEREPADPLSRKRTASIPIKQRTFHAIQLAPTRRSTRLSDDSQSSPKSPPSPKACAAIADRIVKKKTPKPPLMTPRTQSSVLNDNPKVMLPFSEEDLSEVEKEAFLALREWKRARGRELGYNNPCVLAHNRTLYEMIRLLPRDLDDLLVVWGISPLRASQHGDLMLSALEPFRERLLQERGASDTSSSSKCWKGDGRPHPHWVGAQRLQCLPVSEWTNRRTFCVTEYGCRACEQQGPDAPWAAQSQSLLNELAEVYGSLDACDEAGWRWFAKPNHKAFSHNHQWWPPLAFCVSFGVAQVPLGTTAARALLDNARRGAS